MLTVSTRSSPSPPPTPKVRPRVFSTGRQPRPRFATKNSYLASASSAAASDGDSETEAEVLGVRVFVDDDVQARSRSPVKRQQSGDPPQAMRAPSPDARSTLPATSAYRRTILPASARLQLRSPQKAIFAERVHVPLTFSVRFPLELAFDIRRGGETFLLIGALCLASWRLSREMDSPFIVVELILLALLALVHPTFGAVRSPVPIVQSPVIRPSDGRRHSSPPLTASRAREMAFLWTTDARDYRDSPDDGAVTALVFVPIVASTLLYLSLAQNATGSFKSDPIPSYWLIRPLRLGSLSTHSSTTPLQSLILARESLVHMSTLCSFILFCHMSASRWSRWWSSVTSTSTYQPVDWRLQPKGYRTWCYTRFSFMVVGFCLAIRLVASCLALEPWSGITYFEMSIISIAYQFITYVMVRLARRGFTLGELGLVAQGATALFMESFYLTTARIWPITTEYIKTYRTPTPLLLFQVALIPGAFLTGFLLSPILVLSRNLAQKPSHRLRYPDQKTPFRRALAGGFYILAAMIVGGLIGPWTGWCLAPDMVRGGYFTSFLGNPWLWVFRWITEGRRVWSRPALLAYWGSLACLSLAAWSRQLARARKNGKRLVGVPGAATKTTTGGVTSNGNGFMTHRTAFNESVEVSPSPMASTFGGSPTAMGHSMTEFLDAADKHVPTLGLNARRKSFHALAVAMFIPGIALDPAFCHLAFSLAFSLFIFIEYVRYFALYPFSASVHLFMNEFIDEKDGGTAILSHFYLLTGCAAAIWFEGSSRLLEFTGVLVLGVGDAMASIAGKRFGKYRWTSDSPKTVEGSAAFTVSVFLGAWFLRLVGFTEPFSSLRLLIAVTLSSILEALSLQNDNLTLPLYFWAILVLLRALNV